MLYSPFGHIDFYFSVSSRVRILGRFPFTDMLKTQVASLKTSTCTSCLAATVPRHTSSNTWKSECYEYIFYPPRLPPAILSPTVSLQNQLFLLHSPEKATATQTLFVSDCFLSLCAHVRTVLDLVCLWLCVLVYALCLCRIDCCWYVGKWGWISVKKEEQKTIHKQRDWPKEWKRHKMSHISIWDRRRDLFKLSESSFLSDECIQCPPLPLNSKWSMYHILSSCLSVSFSSVWDGAALEGGMFCFRLLSLCFLIPCLCVSCVPHRAITLDNQLVVLATTAADAGRYHVEAVNEMTGENVTSPAVYLSISGKKKTNNNKKKHCLILKGLGSRANDPAN